MIEVELPDGTIVEFPEGTSEDVMRQALYKFLGQPQQPVAAEPAQAPQEGPSVLGDVAASGASGFGRGLAGLLSAAETATPFGMVRGAAETAGKALGMVGAEDAARMVQDYTPAAPDYRGALSALTGGASEYTPQTKVGEYAGTVGEFLPGAMVPGGQGGLLGNLLRYGVAPGVAYQAAEDLTRNASQATQAIAPALASLAAPLAVGTAERAVRRAITPLPGIDPERAALADILDQYGVPMTVGQRTGSETLRRIEGMTKRGAALMDTQQEAFTEAALKTIGANAKRATPEVLDDAAKRIGSVFQDVASGVDVTPDAQTLTKMSQALQEYRALAPAGEVSPIFGNINKELVKSFRTGNPIDARSLMSWRSQLSKLTTDPKAPTRETAKLALETLDDALHEALRAAGRSGDVAKLAKARSQWRNYLVIETAASRAGEKTAVGILSPSNVRNALVAQGRRSYVQGGRGDIGELTRASEAVIKPLPTVNAGGVRYDPGNTYLSSVGAGMALGTALTGNPTGAAVGAGIGALAPKVGSEMLMTAPIQRYLANQAVGAGRPIFEPDIARPLVGLLAQ